MSDGYDKVIWLESAREMLFSELEKLQRNGVGLFVDDVAVLPSEAAAKAVQENSPYMADYVLGETGNIEQVRFDKVTSC